MTAELAQIYDLITPDLERAARIFRDELQSDQPRVDELCRHVEQYRGKQLRPAVVLLSAAACGPIRPAHHVLAAVVEMVHLATLVHDDILDGADLRRRSPTINRRYGSDHAVLLGDYLFSHAYHLCSSLDSQFAARVIGRTAATLCEGELMQAASRGDLALTEQRYFDVISRKTASLIAVCGLLGAKYADADETTCRNLHDYGRSLGIAFQIVDDLLDITGSELEVGKTLGRDLQEGKLTLPLIQYLRSAPEPRRTQMMQILGSDDPHKAARVARLLTDSDSLHAAERAAHEHVRAAVQSLEGLPESEARSGLRAMAEFVTARRY